MARALKPSGQLMLTDLALTEAKAGGAEIEAWIAREATARAPVTLANLTALIESLGLDVRVAEDKGEVYAKLARTALRDFMAGAEEREVPPELRAWSCGRSSSGPDASPRWRRVASASIASTPSPPAEPVPSPQVARPVGRGNALVASSRRMTESAACRPMPGRTPG